MKAVHAKCPNRLSEVHRNAVVESIDREPSASNREHPLAPRCASARSSRTFQGLVAAAAVLGVSGWLFGQVPRSTAVDCDQSLPEAALVDPQVFASFESFSEVDAARAQIRGLGLRALTDFRMRHPAIFHASHRRSAATKRDIDAAIAELRELVLEFVDTEGEPILLNELLRILKKEDHIPAWRAAYEAYARRHPMSELAMRLAGDTARAIRRDNAGEDLDSHESSQAATPEGHSAASGQRGNEQANDQGSRTE